MHASLLSLFRSRVTRIRLEGRTIGDRIAPGQEDFGSIARRHDNLVFFRYWHALKAEECAGCLGPLFSSAHQWAAEHDDTSRNQPPLEKVAARQALDQDLGKTGIGGGIGYRLIMVLHGLGSFRHHSSVAKYMVM
jgi:hypothetical protein